MVCLARFVENYVIRHRQMKNRHVDQCPGMISDEIPDYENPQHDMSWWKDLSDHQCVRCQMKWIDGDFSVSPYINFKNEFHFWKILKILFDDEEIILCLDMIVWFQHTLHTRKMGHDRMWTRMVGNGKAKLLFNDIKDSVSLQKITIPVDLLHTTDNMSETVFAIIDVIDDRGYFSNM